MSKSSSKICCRYKQDLFIKKHHDILQEIYKLQYSAVNIYELYEKAAEIINTIDNIDFCGFISYDIDTKILAPSVFKNFNNDFVENICTSVVKQKLMQIVLENKPVFCDKLIAIQDILGSVGTGDMKCLYIKPVINKGNIFALLIAGSRTISFIHNKTEKMLYTLIDKIADFALSINNLRQLEESEQELRSALEASGDIVWNWNLIDDVIKLISPKNNITGSKKQIDLLSTENFTKLIYSEDLDIFFENYNNYIKGRTNAFYCEHRINCVNGSVKWVLNRGKITESNQFGKAIKMVGTLTDITENKKLQQELYKAKLDAESADKAKSSFLANMSHELRTPMNGIFGNIQLMQFTDLNEEQNEYLEMMNESCSRLILLVNNLIEITSDELENTPVDKKYFFVPEFLDELTTYLKDCLSNKEGIDTYTEIGNTLPMHIYGDSIKIKAILHQFINNAAKFTETGTITMGIEKFNKEIHFYVRDTGIGIENTDLEKLFIRFSQIDNSYTKRFSGVGIGLAICKEYSKLLKSRLLVNSSPGKGSTFTLALPFENENEYMTETENKYEIENKTETGIVIKTEIENKYEYYYENESKSILTADEKYSVPKRKLQILAADDDEVSRLFISRLCEREGVKVILAENGCQALELYLADKPDLVLLDIQMPGMSGLEVVRHIRECESNNDKKTPVIALTAYALKGDRETFIEAGMDDYVSKPVSTDTLCRTIRKYLSTVSKMAKSDL